MKINVPLSQIDLFMRDKYAELRFIRRVESPYLFHVKWYKVKNGLIIETYIHMRYKFGSPKLHKSLFGKNIYTWKLD